MKRLFVLLTLVLPLCLGAQTTDYSQDATLYLKPDFKHLKEFYAAMSAHNKKFHNSGPYKATVYSVDNGEMAGWFVWDMGPCTFAQMDARPSSKEHDDDWDFNVMPYVTDMKYGEYWRKNADLSIDKTDAPDANKFFIRYRNVNNTQEYRVDGLLKKLSATIKEMNLPYSWAVYDNMFRQGNKGRHIAFVSPFKNWAELDKDEDFTGAYEKLYGKNTIDAFDREMSEVFSDSWDEIWITIPELGGGQ